MDYTDENKKNMDPLELLQIVIGDCTLGVHSGSQDKEFHCIFSYAAGGLESLVSDGREWLYRVPRPTFWRAATDNDRGCMFPQKSGMWLAADTFIRVVGVKIFLDERQINSIWGPDNNCHTGEEKASKAEIVFIYQTIIEPATQIEVSYTILNTGVINTKVHYYGQKGLPELPVLGMRFIMPTCADYYRYEGLSGETYPDRKAGGIQGVYEIMGLPVTHYLVPQDCGMHMDTKWLEIYRSTSLSNCDHRKEESVLRFETDNLAFSCLPYTAGELENATHQEELPIPRRTVVCIYGAVRGVGGIDSWMTDVEEPYHISGEEDIEFSFRICL